MSIILEENDVNKIKGKLEVNKASQEEILNFLEYVNKLENLLEEADEDDYYGTEGYRRRLGWN